MGSFKLLLLLFLSFFLATIYLQHSNPCSVSYELYLFLILCAAFSSLSLFPYPCIFVSSPVSPLFSLFLALSSSVCLWLCLSASLSVCESVCLCIFLPLCLYVFLCLSPLMLHNNTRISCNIGKTAKNLAGGLK